MLWFKKKKKPDTDKLLQAVKQLVRAQTLDQITDKALPWPESGHTFHSQQVESHRGQLCYLAHTVGLQSWCHTQ